MSGQLIQSTLQAPAASALAYGDTSAGLTGTGPLAGKYLTFQLGREEFGIRVLKVREIMGLQETTAVPQTPRHVKGVINLRGKVIPVICLRTKFGLCELADQSRACIIVVQLQRPEGPMLMGIVVDGVSEVVNIAATDIEPTPEFGSGAVRPYLLGIAKIRDKVKILLDIDQVTDGRVTDGSVALGPQAVLTN